MGNFRLPSLIGHDKQEYDTPPDDSKIQLVAETTVAISYATFTSPTKITPNLEGIAGGFKADTTEMMEGLNVESLIQRVTAANFVTELPRGQEFYSSYQTFS
ncbi:hypothetical protein T265_05164 [Opisthorchis viverrini]|uniref:Uncharacterized protein n=1 Tax=Opisthorchis viverrini TaxID=6198 RepID=A0A074ZKM6_OPIVI|nr:hypothetical protein T265_05164 [Opisthorchis viverrini]KER27883.1 hypothetical protein T265_05164 [Opisthorchis viverrini]